jgi:hypothetical protein
LDSFFLGSFSIFFARFAARPEREGRNSEDCDWAQRFRAAILGIFLPSDSRVAGGLAKTFHEEKANAANGLIRQGLSTRKIFRSLVNGVLDGDGIFG